MRRPMWAVSRRPSATVTKCVVLCIGWAGVDVGCVTPTLCYCRRVRGFVRRVGWGRCRVCHADPLLLSPSAWFCASGGRGSMWGVSRRPSAAVAECVDLCVGWAGVDVKCVTPALCFCHQVRGFVCRVGGVDVGCVTPALCYCRRVCGFVCRVGGVDVGVSRQPSATVAECVVLCVGWAGVDMGCVTPTLCCCRRVRGFVCQVGGGRCGVCHASPLLLSPSAWFCVSGGRGSKWGVSHRPTAAFAECVVLCVGWAGSVWGVSRLPYIMSPSAWFCVSAVWESMLGVSRRFCVSGGRVR